MSIVTPSVINDLTNRYYDNTNMEVSNSCLNSLYPTDVNSYHMMVNQLNYLIDMTKYTYISPRLLSAPVGRNGISFLDSKEPNAPFLDLLYSRAWELDAYKDIVNISTFPLFLVMPSGYGKSHAQALSNIENLRQSQLDPTLSRMESLGLSKPFVKFFDGELFTKMNTKKANKLLAQKRYDEFNKYITQNFWEKYNRQQHGGINIICLHDSPINIGITHMLIKEDNNHNVYSLPINPDNIFFHNPLPTNIFKQQRNVLRYGTDEEIEIRNNYYINSIEQHRIKHSRVQISNYHALNYLGYQYLLIDAIRSKFYQMTKILPRSLLFEDIGKFCPRHLESLIRLL